MPAVLAEQRTALAVPPAVCVLAAAANMHAAADSRAAERRPRCGGNCHSCGARECENDDGDVGAERRETRSLI